MMKKLAFSLISLSIFNSVSADTVPPELQQQFKLLSPEQQQQALTKLRKRRGTGAVVKESQTAEPAVVVPTKVSRRNVAVAINKEAALQPYGYDLFSGLPTTFAPATDIPVPVNYVIGPNDTVKLQLFGKDNVEYSLVVNRDGTLNFPNIGPVSVAGLTFSEMKENLQAKVHKQMIGVQASISMGQLRSVRVFVLGEANRPGSYTVSALSTMTNALFVSGGVSKVGSLRNIQLKRAGKVVTRLDLYDLLINGDTSADRRLRPGDVLFVPPVGKTVGVKGDVKRPALYELTHENDVSDVLNLAGGLKPTAYQQAARITRISRGERISLDVDLRYGHGLRAVVKDGDILDVGSALDEVDNVVTVSGHVSRPGAVQYINGMRLSTLFSNLRRNLKAGADLSYVLIERQQGAERKLQILSANLRKAHRSPRSSANVKLAAGDKVTIFDRAENRAISLDSLITKLDVQSTSTQAARVVSIDGATRYPGRYPYTSYMSVKDLISASADLLPDADLDYAVIVRQKGIAKGLVTQTVNLRKELAGNSRTNLKPADKLLVFNSRENRETLLQATLERLRYQSTISQPSPIVRVSGFVRKPGDYPLSNGMTVSELLAAAGSLSEAAYGLGAEVTRSVVSSGDRLTVKHIPIDLQAAIAGGTEANMRLQPRDVLHVKRLPNWADSRSVILSGQVKFPGSYPIKKGETLSSVIRRAGGVTNLAYLDGAAFFRDILKKKEAKRNAELARQLKSDLAAASLEALQSDASKAAAFSQAQGLLDQLQELQPVGRLVIDLKSLVQHNDESKDILLADKDELFIPVKPQEVTVIGEVQFATSHLFNPSLARNDYIDRSGGITYKADDKRIFVVRANGQVMTGKGSNWFSHTNAAIRPGDTIVVPLDADRVSSITTWANVSQIVSQIGLSIASFKSVGVF